MRKFVVVGFLLLLAGCGKKPAAPAARSGPMEPAAFWVWHRSSALREDEVAGLREAGTRALFWQVVECGWKDGRWQSTRIARPMAPVEGLSITPVFRIRPETSFLGDGQAAARFATMVKLWAEGAALPAIQLDFDCPERLLARYGKFIREVGRELPGPKISITALAGWPRSPEFGVLAESVSSMAPMFYDLHADPPEEVRQNRLRPIADPASEALIGLWKDCPVPWLAGLPNFERVSIYLADGRLSGHARGWSATDLVFHPDLDPRALGNGITLYEPESALGISGTAVAGGSRIVHRMPERSELGRLAHAAERAGAAGVIYFALAGPGIQTAYSARHLAAGAEEVRLEVSRQPDGALTLRNPGPADLPIQTTGGGWRLVLECETAGNFSAGSVGGFPLVSVPGNLPAEISRSLSLHFARLAAGESITSGAGLAGSGALRWSVPGATAGAIVKSR